MLTLKLLFIYLGIAKYRYEEFKSPMEMTAADYDKLPAKNNWTPEVKRSFASILIGVNEPPVILSHFAVGVVYHVKAYGQYGQLTKRYETACKVVNYALFINRVVVPHRKLGGQRLRQLTREMLQSWAESLCDNFSGEETERYFQGDGAAPDDIAVSLVESGVPEHALTDGGERSAQQLFSHYLYTIKAQKEAEHHLLSDAEKARDAVRVNMMNNINRVTSGKFNLSFILYFSLRYICNLTFFCFHLMQRFTTY